MHMSRKKKELGNLFEKSMGEVYFLLLHFIGSRCYYHILFLRLYIQSCNKFFIFLNLITKLQNFVYFLINSSSCFKSIIFLIYIYIYSHVTVDSYYFIIFFGLAFLFTIRYRTLHIFWNAKHYIDRFILYRNLLRLS